jgi:hypothetical protein
MDDLVRSSWGVILAASIGAHALIVAVLVALVIAAIVGLVLYVVVPTRPFAGPAAIIVFLIALVLLLL